MPREEFTGESLAVFYQSLF